MAYHAHSSTKEFSPFESFDSKTLRLQQQCQLCELIIHWIHTFRSIKQNSSLFTQNSSPFSPHKYIQKMCINSPPPLLEHIQSPCLYVSFRSLILSLPPQGPKGHQGEDALNYLGKGVVGGEYFAVIIVTHALGIVKTKCIIIIHLGKESRRPEGGERGGSRIYPRAKL